MSRKPGQPTSVDRVRDFIETYRQRTGIRPTFGEIRVALGYDSASALRSTIRKAKAVK